MLGHAGCDAYPAGECCSVPLGHWVAPSEGAGQSPVWLRVAQCAMGRDWEPLDEAGGARIPTPRAARRGATSLAEQRKRGTW